MSNEKRSYILVSDEKTWRISLDRQIFGISEKTKGYWKTVNEGEFFAIYVMVPIGKIIGFGKIKRKFVDDELVFPDEIFFQKPILKYRLEIEPIHIIEEWDQGLSVPPGIILNTGRKVVTNEIFQNFIYKARKKWSIELEQIQI